MKITITLQFKKKKKIVLVFVTDGYVLDLVNILDVNDLSRQYLLL